jgi:hypothetical protein
MATLRSDGLLPGGRPTVRSRPRTVAFLSHHDVTAKWLNATQRLRWSDRSPIDQNAPQRDNQIVILSFGVGGACLKFTAADFHERYSRMSDAELALIRKEDLTATARACYECEVGRRKVAPSVLATPALMPARSNSSRSVNTRQRDVARLRLRERFVHILLAVSSVGGLIRFLGKFAPYALATSWMDLVWASCLGGAALIAFPAARGRERKSGPIPGMPMNSGRFSEGLLIFGLALWLYGASCAYEILWSPSSPCNNSKICLEIQPTLPFVWVAGVLDLGVSLIVARRFWGRWVF